MMDDRYYGTATKGDATPMDGFFLSHTGTVVVYVVALLALLLTVGVCVQFS